MKRCTLKSIVSLLLVASLVAGLLPIDSISMQIAAAEEIAEQRQAQQENAQAVFAEAELDFAGIAELARSRLSEDVLRDDGEWQYVVLPEYQYAVIVKHLNAEAVHADIPAVLGGADVVALLSGVFEGHDRLEDVTVTGNVYFAEAGAFPRGVTLRGYHGSFAQNWAAQNRYAFENLSELDFVPGVVDCSDIDVMHFLRYSEKQVALRALEAGRLGEGSIFFLADPANAYAISFYRVVSIGEAELDGFVMVECETPDISEVLNSFEIVDQIMMPDTNTIQTFDGVSVDTNTSRATGGAASGQINLKISVPIKWPEKGISVEVSGGYTSAMKISADYGNLSLNTYKLTQTESLLLTGKLNLKHEYGQTDGSGIDDKEYIETFLGTLRDVDGLRSTSLYSNEIPLAKITVFSLWGILSAQVTVQFHIEISGSFEITYSSTTETTHYYDRGEYTASSTKKKDEFEGKFEGKAKIGPSVSIKLLLFVVDFATMDVFLGLVATGVYKEKLDADTENITNEDILLQCNMMDCIEITIDFVIELSAKIGVTLGGIKLEAFSGQWKPIDVELLKNHLHVLPTKWIWNADLQKGIKVSKEEGDHWHDADTCPLKNNVLLMVPEIDLVNPVGTAMLTMGDQLYRPTTLLRNERARVDEWYYDEDLTQRIASDAGDWPITIRAGSKIYGQKTEIHVTSLVNFAGKPVTDIHGNDAYAALAEGESVNTADLELECADHIVGWAYVNSASDPTIIDGLDSIVWSDRLDLTCDGEDHTLMVLFDDDFTIDFLDLNGQKTTVTAGHYQPIDAIELPVTWNEEVWEISWVDIQTNKAVDFPYTADKASGNHLQVRAKMTMKQRVVPADSTMTRMTSSTYSAVSGTVFAAPEYFTYTTNDTGLTIKGFQSKQSYVDEDGNTVQVTVDPDILMIPAYIDGKPVTQIESGAFSNNQTLVDVILPATITSIGYSAFANCPSLTSLDLSACSKLPEIPYRMADGDSALADVTINSHVTSIGQYAFRNCTAIESAVINASIGDNAFEGCTGLSSVTLRNQVTSIGQYAFKNCTAITELTVPFSVETVGSYFISGCTGLTRLELDGAPTEVTSGMMYIGINSQLAELVINNGVTTIGSNAFSNHPNLVSITLPETLQSVGNKALSGTAVAYLKIYDLGLLGTGFARDCTTLRELEFEVGTINSYAFAECTNLTKVTLGRSVYAIADHAFYDCTSLTEIAGGGNVQSLGIYAMYGCSSLTAFDTGDAVEEIGAYAFSGCTSLEQINMGNALVSVGSYAFYNCTSLQALFFPPTVQMYGKNLIEGCEGLKTLSVGGPAQPVLNGNSTFSMKWSDGDSSNSLETLIVNEGVTSIGNDVFSNSYYSGTRYGYANLKQISLPSTLGSIGDNAFYGSGAATIVFPNGGFVETIGNGAFESNPNLIAFDAGDEIKRIGSKAFFLCTALEELKLGKVLVNVGDFAFAECTALQELFIPPTVETVGNAPIRGCSGLKTLALGGKAMPILTDIWSINQYSSKKNTLETLIINEGVTSIGDYLAQDNEYANLKRISLPSTLKHIGNRAFDGSGASVIDFPNGGFVETIGDYAFRNNNNLLLFDAGDSVEAIGAWAFSGCTSLEHINLGAGLTSVGDWAFQMCTALQELHFPPTVEVYGQGVISHCEGLKTLSLGGPAQPVLSGESTFSVIVTQPMTSGGTGENSLETLIINEGVTSIGSDVFSNWGNSSYREGFRNLKIISLPSTIRSIDDYAFWSSGATVIDFPNGGFVETIGANAFRKNTNLKMFDAGDLVETIGAEAFLGCTSLEHINLGNELRSIGNSVFSYCTSLQELYFPPTVETYGEGMIARCTGLKTLSVGGMEQPVLSGVSTFSVRWDIYGSTPLIEHIIINEGVVRIGDEVFSNSNGERRWGYTKLKRISLPSTLQSIGDNAFYGATSLEELILPDGIETIDDNAFNGCSGLSLQTGEYNENVAAYAQTAGIPYTWDFGGTHTQTLLAADGTLLGEAELPAGADLTQTLEAGAPEDEDGETFYAWYTSEESTAVWQGTTMPNFDLTLYAGMTPLHDVVLVLVHEGQELLRYTVQAGEGLDMPCLEEPSLAGYRFGGWFTDEACTQLYTGAGKMPAGDVTLYGSMVSDTARAIYAAAGDHAVLTKLILQPGDSTEVWLPDTVNGLPLTEIAEGAFAQAAGITVLRLPDGLTDFDPETFEGLTSLRCILTGAQSSGFAARGGALYSRDMTRLIYVPAGLSTTSFKVPAGVTTIGANAFAANPWLKEVVLPDSTTTLEDNALYACASLEKFTAYGLTSIGENALPTYAVNLHVYGPVRTGALRAFLYTGTYSGIDGFICPYNSYTITLYVDGEARTEIGLEAGSTLPYAFLYGEMEDGQIIHTWFTDSGLTSVWNPDDPLPAADLNLYASQMPQYAYETAEFEVDGETVSGIRLTAYNGLGGSIVLPGTIDGLPVLAIGGDFLASCHGVVKSVQIGSEVMEIEDTALVGPAEYPFGGTVYADAGSYAEQWAIRMGYALSAGQYTLSFESNGGTEIVAKTLSAGTAVRLGLPIRDGCEFAGWFMDEALNTAVTLEDGCFIMPGRDVTLYAAWTGDAQTPAFDYEVIQGEVVVTGCDADATELILPEAVNGMPVTAIADNAFLGHASLRTIVLPAAMKTIGSYAFMGSALETAELGGARMVGANAFADCAALTLVTADEAQSLGAEAFARCTALTGFHVGAGLELIDPSCFRNCTAMRAITVDADNSVFAATDGVLIRGGTTLWCYPAGKRDIAYTVADGISTIGANAFSGNAYLKRIELPEHLESIGERAFMGCTSLERFALGDSMTVPVIPQKAFSGCEALGEVVLNDRVLLIESGAFSGCISLSEVEIPESVISIDDFAFTSGSQNTLTIRGVYGSEAWRFALDNGYRFVSVSTTEVTGLSIAMEETMLLGTSAALTAGIEPADAVLNGELQWTTSDAGVVYLYDGTAYAVGEGEAVLTVAAPNGVSHSVKVTVCASSLRITSYPVYLVAGATEAIAIEAAGEVLPEYEFAVEDGTILSVSVDGMLTGLKPGTTSVYVVTGRGIEASCSVTVVEAALSCRTLTLMPGQSVQIGVLLDIPGTAGNYTWASDESGVASVAGDVITANGAGTTVLRYSLSGSALTVSLTVSDSLATVTLPYALRQLADEALYGNSAAERVVPGGALVTVGSGAMAQMTSLRQVILPATVQSIADDAFEGDGMLTLLCTEGSYGHMYARTHGIPYVVVK